LIDPNGILFTAYHVIEGARAISVNMSNGAFFPIEKVMYVDSQTDFAMLKVAGRNLPALKLGDSDGVQVGEQVIALGSPLGLENSVSTGIISGRRRLDDHVLLQTTAPISPGSSGGPLLDGKGQVIGISVLSASGGQNLNFALAINDAKRVQANPSPKSDAEKSIQAYLTGLLYLNNKDYVNAEKSLLKATELDPKNVDAWLDLGTTYYNIGKKDKEGQAYKKALELRPTSDDAHYLLGTWYEDKGEFDAAAEEFRKVLSLNPKYEGALFDLALLELIRGRRTEAMQAYQQLRPLNYGLALKLFRILEVSDKARSTKP
jgi:tetratricopeptide (TPR) repeat protein